MSIYLKLDQLKENTLYECALSGKNVLITNISEGETTLLNGEKVFFKNINGLIYNEITGFYDPFFPHDNQLMNLQ